MAALAHRARRGPGILLRRVTQDGLREVLRQGRKVIAMSTLAPRIPGLAEVSGQLRSGGPCPWQALTQASEG